jgi:hypothetical protein
MDQCNQVSRSLLDLSQSSLIAEPLVVDCNVPIPYTIEVSNWVRIQNSSSMNPASPQRRTEAAYFLTRWCGIISPSVLLLSIS